MPLGYGASVQAACSLSADQRADIFHRRVSEFESRAIPATPDDAFERRAISLRCLPPKRIDVRTYKNGIAIKRSTAPA